MGGKLQQLEEEANQQLPQLRLLRFLLELLLLPRLQLSPRRQQRLPLRLDQQPQNQQQVAAPSPLVLEQLRLQQHHPPCSALEGQALLPQQQHRLPSSQV